MMESHSKFEESISSLTTDAFDIKARKLIENLATRIQQKESCDDLLIDLMKISNTSILAQEFLLLLLLTDIFKNNMNLTVFSELETILFKHISPTIKETLKDYLRSILNQSPNAFFQPNQQDPIKRLFINEISQYHSQDLTQWLSNSQGLITNSPFLNIAKFFFNMILSDDPTRFLNLESSRIVAIIPPTQIEQDKNLIIDQLNLIAHKLSLCMLILTSFNSHVSTILENKEDFNRNISTQIGEMISNCFTLLSSYPLTLLNNDLNNKIEEIIEKIFEIKKTNIMQDKKHFIDEMLFGFVSNLPNASMFCAIKYMEEDEFPTAFKLTSFVEKAMNNNSLSLDPKYDNISEDIEAEYYKLYPPENGPEFSIF